MCGICGVLRRDRGDVETVRGMNTRMVHRGPDDEGVYEDDMVVLGMRRLKVIDLEGGHQPFGSEDGAIWIVLNGEIYNYRELARELAAFGWHPRSRSDTEIALLAYRQWGDAFLERLIGMFALCIWDRHRQRALIARDRLGKKPLYYWMPRSDGRLVFASELKCLFADPAFDAKLDPAACRQFVQAGYIGGADAVLQGVHRLQPGHVMAIDVTGRRQEDRAYWTMPRPSPPARPARWKSPEAAADEFGALLTDAVRMRLVSDVPVGAFLSGGLDSSLVVSLMRQAGHANVKTFSVGFPTSGAIDESEYSAAVAAELGTDHHPFAVGPDALALLPRVAWQMDEPLADQAVLPTYLLSELARRDVTVVLTGEGADELFGGYDRYALFAAMARIERVVGPRALGAIARLMPVSAESGSALSRIARLARGATNGFAASYATFTGPFGGLADADVLGPSLKAPAIASAVGLAERLLETPGVSRLGRMQYADLLTWLPDDLLVKVDRASMAWSLEARCPFLDHRLVEMAADIPDQWKIRGRTTKWLLHQIAARSLPASIARRRKHIFAMPLAQWFRGPLAALARDTLTPSGLSAHGMFHPALATRLLDRHARGEDLSRPIWALLMFQLWFDGLRLHRA